MNTARRTVLVHLASGIGNIVLATPLLAALYEMGFTTDVLISADYPEMAGLFRDWSRVRGILTDIRCLAGNDYDHIIPAVPPFYWQRFEHAYPRSDRVIRRPPPELF